MSRLPYKRGFSFSGYQANTPGAPLPGPRVDIEFDKIADGLANAGASAYDLAVLNGFIGTPDDYLASLKGADGSALSAAQLAAPGNAVSDAIKASPAVNGPVISTADPRFLGGSKADCTAQGVGTDLAPILFSAFNYGVATYKNAFRIQVPQGAYRLATAAVLDGQGAVGVVIEILGTVTTDSAQATFITVQNMQDLTVILRATDGGRFAGYGAPLPYYVDYSTVEDVVSNGGQELLQVRGVFGCTLDLYAKNYAGRLLHTAQALPGQPPTGAIKGRIVTTRGISLSLPRVAQSLWCDPGTNTGQGNWGHLASLVNDFDYYPPVWRDLNDIAITTLDAAYSQGGPIFRGCVRISMEDAYVGDVDGNASGYHMQFVPAPGTGRKCGIITLGRLHMLNDANGVIFQLLDPNTAGAKIGHILQASGSVRKFATVVTIDRSANIEAKVEASGNGSTLAAISGAGTTNIRLDLVSPIGGCDSNNAFITNVAAGSTFEISGTLQGIKSGYSGLVVDTGTAIVLLDKLNVRYAGGAGVTINQSTNKVAWRNGSYGGSSGTQYGSANRPTLGDSSTAV